MRSILIVLVAGFLAAGLLGCCGAAGQPLPELTLRSPLVPGWTAPGAPVRAVQGWQTAGWGAPQLAPGYAPAAAPCTP